MSAGLPPGWVARWGHRGDFVVLSARKFLAQPSLDRTRGRRLEGLRKIGLLPISTQLQALYNADGPKDSSDWKLRFQVQFPQARLCYMKPSRSITLPS
jgi:hypothetical protein